MSVPVATVGAMTAIASLAVVVLDCRDPHTVARFYSGVTGAEIERAEDDWVQLRAVSGVALAFQLAPDHVPPRWPGAEQPQQVHLDFDVPDLDAAQAQVLALGARKHEVQPDPRFRVYLDPAGHPFCLVRAE